MAELLVLDARNPKPLTADTRCAGIHPGTAYGRATFCHTGFIGNISRGRLVGFGINGYELPCRQRAGTPQLPGTTDGHKKS